MKQPTYRCLIQMSMNGYFSYFALSGILTSRQVYVIGMGCNNCAVTLFPHFKTSPNSLPPLFSSSLAYLLFFLSLRSHLFFSFSSPLSRDHPFAFYLLFPQPRQLNELLPHFLHLSVCRTRPPPSFHSHLSLPPISAGFSFKALITRSASILATGLITLDPTNLISCFISGDLTLIIRHIWCFLKCIPVCGACMYALRYVLACLTACEQVYLHACVCLSPHVSASLLLADAAAAIYDSGGTRYRTGTRRVGEKEKEKGEGGGGGEGEPW